MLLAITIGGPGKQAAHLRQLASACGDRAWNSACAAVADAIDGRVDVTAARDAVAAAGAPFVAEVIGLQLAAHTRGAQGEGPQTAISRSGAGRLAELILEAVQ